MSRRPNKNRSRAKTRRAAESQPRLPFWRRALSALLNLPRLVRVLIAAFFALTVALVISLILFYESIFYNRDLLVLLAIIALAFGLAMYLVGWQLIVGTIGERPPVRPAILWYVGIGLLSIFVIILWLIQLTVIGAGAL